MFYVIRVQEPYSTVLFRSCISLHHGVMEAQTKYCFNPMGIIEQRELFAQSLMIGCDIMP